MALPVETTTLPQAGPPQNAPPAWLESDAQPFPAGPEGRCSLSPTLAIAVNTEGTPDTNTPSVSPAPPSTAEAAGAAAETAAETSGHAGGSASQLELMEKASPKEKGTLSHAAQMQEQAISLADRASAADHATVSWHSRDDAAFFEGAFVLTVPPTGGINPNIKFRYPDDDSNKALDAEFFHEFPRYCFPYHDKANAGLRAQKFTFYWGGAALYGFCIQNEPATPASDVESICVVTKLGWHGVFHSLAHQINALWQTPAKRGHLKQYLDTANIRLNTTLAKREITFGKELFVKPFVIQRPDDVQHPATAEFTSIFALCHTLGTTNLLTLFASFLFDRRIIVTSSDVGQITGCIYTMNALLFPLRWEHVLIPIMPKHLLDYCLAPMPFVVGLHSSLLEVVQQEPLEPHVLVDLDTNTVTCPHNDHDRIPPDLLGPLRAAVKAARTAKKVDDVEHIPAAFLAFFVELLGNCKDHLIRETQGPIGFDRRLHLDTDAYLNSKPKNYRQFLETMSRTQSFAQLMDQQVKEATPRPVKFEENGPTNTVDPDMGRFERVAAAIATSDSSGGGTNMRWQSGFQKLKVKVRRLRTTSVIDETEELYPDPFAQPNTAATKSPAPRKKGGWMSRRNKNPTAISEKPEA